VSDIAQSLPPNLVVGGAGHTPLCADSLISSSPHPTLSPRGEGFASHANSSFAPRGEGGGEGVSEIVGYKREGRLSDAYSAIP
jgi:hypothetical protein